MSVFSNSLWHGVTPPLPRWSWFDKCIPNRAAPFGVTTLGPGGSIIPWAWRSTSEAVQPSPWDNPPDARSGVTAQSCLTPAGFPNHHSNAAVLRLIIHSGTTENLMSSSLSISIHTVMLINAFENIQFSFLRISSLRTAIYPLSLCTNFTFFKYRKLHPYKREECLFSLLPPRIACSQVWWHLDFSVRRMPIYYVFFLTWKNAEIFFCHFFRYEILIMFLWTFAKKKNNILKEGRHFTWNIWTQIAKAWQNYKPSKRTLATLSIN